MPAFRTLGDLDKICLFAREHFRSHLSNKHEEVDGVFTLCFDIFKSVIKFRKPEEWRGSREGLILAVLIQSIETVLAMYYLSESGFWTNALVLKRNFEELLLIAIAIGYDEQCFIDWKHGRHNFDSFEKVFVRVMQSSQVPDIDKSFIRSLKQDWTKSSQLFSHNINQKSIRTFVKNGQIRFEPKAATAEFQEKRMNTIRNMLLDVISVLLGIFNYSSVVASRREEFPEALGIIARCNQYFQNQTWKNEGTK